MTDPSRAVFVSYASQDAVAANRICDALRHAGIAVWLDQSALQGGEAWDQQIRERIQACRLFIAVISANTQARDEGYFRREWKLAVDRTDDLAEDMPFLLPVVIDHTDQATARVPRKFREVQWLRLDHGEPSREFLARITQLLATGPVPGNDQARASGHPIEVPSVSPGLSTTNRRSAAWMLAGPLLLIAAIGGIWIATHRTSGAPHTTSKISTAPIVPVDGSPRSLAVLPFVDMSERHDQEYFADGMSEELSDLLAHIPELSVIGRTSAFQFKGRNVDLKSIGSKLGARYVVEGSVRKSDARIRITAQLIDTHSGAHVWSDKYDRDFSDTLQLQEQIATSIARVLQLAIISTDTGSRPRSMDAYTLYLHGRMALDRGDLASYAEAQEEFEQALQLDPTFTRAAEGVMMSYLNRVYMDVIPSKVGWPHLQELANRTLEQDPKSMLAHTVLAWFHYSYSWDVVALNAEVDKVISSHSRDPTTLYYAGYPAGAAGRTEDGLRLIHAAIAFDPLNPDVYQALGGVLEYGGDSAGAERAWRRSLEISPSFAGSHLYIGATRLFQGRPQDALPEILAEEGLPEGRTAMLAATYYALGRRQESDACMTKLLKLTNAAFWTAAAYTWRHENDLAFEWLEKAAASRDLSVSTARSSYFTPLHADARWKPLLDRIGLPE